MTAAPGPPFVGSLILALRPHQWAKNTLLFLPALAAHLAWTGDVAIPLGGAFIAFSLLASATYLLNDLADLQHDRQHPTKRHRAVAAGLISVPAAVTVAVALIGVAALVALQFRVAFQVALAVYLALTTIYSLVLRRFAVLDVIALATLYTIRVVAGAAVVDVALSRWFLAFAVFLFLSLALLKRVIELQDAIAENRNELAGRGYLAGDLHVLVALGLATAAASTLVYCLYITGEDVNNLYARPDVLWSGFLLLLYWEARLWLLAVRKSVHQDPVVFALRDRASYVVVVAFLVMVWLAA
jgi:4-hydroxybenzoate polyprenyltransferase